MGLQNQLTDISTESIPILMVALLANCISYLRSILFGFFQAFDPQVIVVDDDSLYDVVGSGLTSVIMLAEQLNLNQVFSHKFSGSGLDMDMDCVVCLNGLGDGEQVRKLACGHVFHKQCFDGWLDCMKFSCPLCRMKLFPDERVSLTKRRVACDVLDWFSLSR